MAKHYKPIQANMAFTLNKPGLKVPLIKSDLILINQYLVSCDQSGFVGPNSYNHNKEREYFYKWHLYEFQSRVANKLLALYHHPESKKVNLIVTEPEQYALSAMFKRVDCCPYMLSLQNRFINGLTPIK